MSKQKKVDDATNLISSLMEKVAGKGDSKGSSLPVTLILVGIIVLILAVSGLKMAFTKRKAAKLAAQIRKAEEEKKRVEENLKLTDNAIVKQAHWEEIRAISKEILVLKSKMAIRQIAHKKAVKSLQLVTSWDDIEIMDGRDG